MHFELNRTTIKKMLAEPGHSVLEYSLMRTALNAMNAAGKKADEANTYKQHLARIYGGIMTQFPWVKEVHERAVFYTQRDVMEKAKTMFPMGNPPYMESQSDDTDG